MRRIVVAALLALVALTLVACGGGETNNAPAGETGAAAPPAAPGPVAAAPGVDTHSPTETVTNEPFPQTKTTPDAVLTRLRNGQPMILFFYDDSQADTAEQRAALEAVVEKYRGLIDLLSYDIRAGLRGSPSEKDPETQKAVEMAATLKISYTPYILFVDRAGRVTYRFNGFTDQGLLEREALRATQ